MLTREWPPDIYGGAGVHIDQLVAHLRELAEVDVQCFGQPRADALAHPVPEFLADANPALQTLGVDLAMVSSISAETDVVHSHTWYANLAGHLAALLLDVPHVLTAHSLEPLRPWKREQLAGGYEISSWVERTSYQSSDAIIAVSNGMKADILGAYPEVNPAKVHVVHNGIDTDIYRPLASTSALERFGIDQSRPYALFVGRITRQKGLIHLLRSARNFDENVNLVLCASSPDTPEIAAETAEAIEILRTERRPESVIWIEQQVDKESLIELLTHARVFTCPSIYEPLGIVNLEAMACETAVVASAVGGIPEVVDNGVTGTLVPYDPNNEQGFEQAFAAAVNELMIDEAAAASYGKNGRARAIEHFSWTAIAEQTMNVYRWALNERRSAHT
jgi:starch synthase